MTTFILSSPRRKLGNALLALIVIVCCSQSMALAQQDGSAPTQPVLAQTQEDGNWLGDITRRVVKDPTTWAPAVIFFPSQYLDWVSSQPFFRNGYHERNFDFTVSGNANDVPVSFGEGNKRIVRNTFINLSTSMVHNLTENLFERQLVERFPQHRTLIRRVGWIERVAVGSYIAYYTSAPHYRQWRENERMARQLGYK